MAGTQSKRKAASSGSAAPVLAAVAAAAAVAGGIAFALLKGKGGAGPGATRSTSKGAPSRAGAKGAGSKSSRPSSRSSGGGRTSKGSGSRGKGAAKAAAEPDTPVGAAAEAAPAAASGAAAAATTAGAAASASAFAPAAANGTPKRVEEPEPEGEELAEGEAGEDEMIELQEGETVPVVDEDGNEIGLLQHDGIVVDAQGRTIGGLNEEGQVVLYAGAGEDGDEGGAGGIELTDAEQEAEKLMQQAAIHWNMHKNRAMAEKLQRKALEAVQGGEARPEVVAEVASSLADMLYAQDKLEEAQEAVETAMASAEAGGNHALYIKLSNNLGAVLRKQAKHAEGKELHTKALNLALEHYGREHGTATLARGNLIDALDALGEVDAARALLQEFTEELLALAAKREAEMPPDEPQAAAAEAEGEEGEDGGPRALGQVSERLKPRSAAIRCSIELGRLEMKAKDFGAAKAALGSALAMAREQFGDESPEYASVLAVYATCHRQAGELEAAAPLYVELYELNQATAGSENQSAVMLGRTVADLLGELQRYEEAAGFAERALASMQAVVGVKVHPLLEPFFNQVIDFKTKAGDEAGAEEVRRNYLRGMMALKQAAAGRQQAAPSGGAAGAPSLPKRPAKRR